MVQAWGRRCRKLISTDVFVLCRRLFPTVLSGNRLYTGAVGEFVYVSDSMFLPQMAKVVEWLSFSLDPWIVSRGHYIVWQSQNPWHLDTLLFSPSAPSGLQEGTVLPLVCWRLFHMRNRSYPWKLEPSLLNTRLPQELQ